MTILEIGVEGDQAGSLDASCDLRGFSSRHYYHHPLSKYGFLNCLRWCSETRIFAEYAILGHWMPTIDSKTMFSRCKADGGGWLSGNTVKIFWLNPLYLRQRTYNRHKAIAKYLRFLHLHEIVHPIRIKIQISRIYSIRIFQLSASCSSQY